MTARFALRLISGAQAGESIPIEREGVLIGRRPGNDLVLKDASVSGRHALIRQEGEQVVVEDLGSTNGTRVDGEKVERAEISPSSSLKLGNIELELVDAQGSGTSAPQASDSTSPASSIGTADSGGMPAAAAGGFELEDEISLEDPDDLQLPAASVPSEPQPELEMPTLSPSTPPAPAKKPAAAPAPKPAAPEPRVQPKAAPQAVPSKAPEFTADDQDDASMDIDLDALERSGSGSQMAALVVGLLILGAGGAAAWLFLGQGDEGGEEVAPSVAEIPGNRIGAEFSFEVPAEQWTFVDEEGTSQSFDSARDYAASGRFGVGVDLLAGGRAVFLSEAQTVRSGQAIEGRAEVVGTGQASARLGLELSSSKEDQPSMWLLGETVQGQSEDADPVSLDVLGNVTLGYDRVRLALLGTGPGGDVEGEPVGSAGFDDVALLIDSGAAPALPAGSHGFEGFAASARPVQWTLARAGRALLQFQVQSSSRKASPAAGLDLTAGSDAGRYRAKVAGMDGQGAVRIWLTPRLWEASESAVSTLAAGQFETQGASFTREGVDVLLLGGALDRVGLRFDAPATVSSRPDRGGVELTVDLASAGGFEVQLSFDAESTAAVQLAGVARLQEGDGERGAALETWGRLLGEYPFASELAAEAQGRMARLESEGLKRLAAVELELDRAEFFQLTGMYREASALAESVARDFGADQGRENAVTARAAELQATAGEALARLGAEAGIVRLSQRGAIAEYFQKREAQDLADRVHQANAASLLEDR